VEGKYKHKPTVALALSLINAKNNPEVDRSQWLRADEVAAALRKSVANTYVIAHREAWVRDKVGNKTYYSKACVSKYFAKAGISLPWGPYGETFFTGEK
jgi:hypothetical protein